MIYHIRKDENAAAAAAHAIIANGNQIINLCINVFCLRHLNEFSDKKFP